MSYSNLSNNHNGEYLICGVKSVGYNSDGSGDCSSHGLLVWGKLWDYCYGKDDIHDRFATAYFQDLSMWGVLNSCGISAAKPFLGGNLHAIRLTRATTGTSIISGDNHSISGRLPSVNASGRPEDLLSQWFVDYCKFVLLKVDPCRIGPLSLCHYCHFKYDDSYALVPMASFEHGGEEGLDYSAFELSAPCNLDVEFDDGDPDFGGGGYFSSSHRINYCPMCGRLLLPKHSDVDKYVSANGLTYRVNSLFGS